MIISEEFPENSYLPGGRGVVKFLYTSDEGESIWAVKVYEEGLNKYLVCRKTDDGMISSARLVSLDEVMLLSLRGSN